MAQFKIDNVSISGMAAAVPKNVVYNRDYTPLTENARKLLIKTTGVEEKRAAPKGLTTSDLCYEAAQELIKSLAWKKEDIGILIFVSQSPDYYLPATSIILQDRLGLSQNCMSFDIGLGCSGYVYGLSILSSMMQSTGIKKGLLLAGDVSSATCSYADKSTFPLFGDAGSATAITLSDNKQSMSFSLKNDGSRHDAILINDGGLRNLISEESSTIKTVSEGISRSDLHVALKGMDIFNFSVKEVPLIIKEFVEEFYMDLTSQDYLILHQANKLMNETIRKKLKLPESKVPYSIRKFGNTSSASIPLTIVTELKDKCKNSNIEVLMAGFGVGLSWGVCQTSLHKICCPELIEV